jgi:Uma2 family endonuclease
MSTTESKARYTPEDLLAMPDGDRYELVDGNLVERNVSALSSLVAAKLIRLIGVHCEANDLAWYFSSDCGYRCFPGSPSKVRRPDASFVNRRRLPADELSEGYINIAPDLAAEVVSPNDLAYEVDEKVDEYLGAGVRLVWVVNPRRRTVSVHRADGSVSVLREHEDLDGEDVLPGFRCRVGELFPPTAAVAPSP